MDLARRSVGDWDVLCKRDDMIVAGGTDEGDQLLLGLHYAVIITIEPEEGKARVEVFYKDVWQEMDFEWTLGIPRKAELAIEWALGVLRKHEDLIIEIPLMRLIESVDLLLKMPLKIKPIELTIRVSKDGKHKRLGASWIGKLGKTRKKTVKSLQELRKLLEEEGLERDE